MLGCPVGCIGMGQLLPERGYFVILGVGWLSFLVDPLSFFLMFAFRRGHFSDVVGRIPGVVGQILGGIG